MTGTMLYERRNVDNIFNRVVIAGLLDLLNNKVCYDQIWQDNVVENVCVPFVYAFSNDWNERFAQDFYTFFGRECFSDKLIDGKFDMLPRGAVKYTGSNIDSGNITNRFVKGTYIKDENGKLTSYTAFLYSIPLTFNFEVEMWIDNIDTAFKVEQAMREAFYKNKTYTVLYRGMKIACCAGFPETVTGEKTMQYSFDSDRQLKITFNLAVETYQPCFDQSTEIESGNSIDHFAIDVNHYTNGNGPSDSSVVGRFVDVPSKWVSGSSVDLKWESSSNTSDVCTISILYADSDGQHHIASPLFNQGEYTWNIPDDFNGYVQPSVSYIESDTCRVIEMPVLKIIPNSNKSIDASSFIIMDGGKFETSGDGLVDMSLEYVDEDGDVIVSDAYAGAVVGGKLVGVVLEGSAMKYPVVYESKKISVILQYPITGEILDKIDNVVII